MRILLRAGLASLCIALPACLATADAKPTRTAIPDVPWIPTGAAEPKVIYGTDDRIDVYQEGDARRLTWAASTCGLFTQGRLQLQGNGTYRASTSAYRPGGLTPCADEPFANQPTAAFCSGWMAGPDLIVTAGHCFDDNDLNSTWFVFGFDMQSASTAVTTFNANQVYRGVELLGRVLSGNQDYAVVRVDRNITAPGAVPFPIRREGVVPVGTAIGVIGHPAGLPKKIAFGPTTAVRANSNTGYFVANLDTYGGNSGSPVINVQTGVAEGILVRGEVDYVTSGGCGRSNRVSDSGGRGEDVSKTTTFAQYIPADGVPGGLAFDASRYPCEGVVQLTLTDNDLRGRGSATVTVLSSAGDSELRSLMEAPANSGTFTGTLNLVPAQALPGNGRLEVADGVALTARYADANAGGNTPATVEATAQVDCAAPAIAGIEIVNVTGSQAELRFQTNEPATGRAVVGTACGGVTAVFTGTLATDHRIALYGLARDTTHFAVVQATDAAGNSAEDDNAGQCHTFTTQPPMEYLTELLSGNAAETAGLSLLFTPSSAPEGYALCVQAIDNLPTEAAGGTVLSLSDDGSALVNVQGGRQVLLFGTPHSQFHVGSNGYITFGTGSDEWEPSLDAHFSLPRIAALFTDLNPAARGTVSHRQFSDRVAVTWTDVPQWQSALPYPAENSNTFQIELFFNGNLRISYGALSANTALAGLSRGLGRPADFENSALRAAPACPGSDTDSDGDGINDLDERLIHGTDPFDPDTDDDGMHDGWEIRNGLNPLLDDADLDADGDGLDNGAEHSLGTRADRVDSDRDGIPDAEAVALGMDPTGASSPHHADADGNGALSLGELLRVLQFYRAGALHCNALAEDGYQPGAGPQDCARHHADYANPAWSVDATEVLRVIELYLSGGYTRDLYSMDTFAPAP